MHMTCDNPKCMDQTRFVAELSPASSFKRRFDEYDFFIPHLNRYLRVCHHCRKDAEKIHKKLSKDHLRAWIHENTLPENVDRKYHDMLEIVNADPAIGSDGEYIELADSPMIDQAAFKTNDSSCTDGTSDKEAPRNMDIEDGEYAGWVNSDGERRFHSHGLNGSVFASYKLDMCSLSKCQEVTITIRGGLVVSFETVD